MIRKQKTLKKFESIISLSLIYCAVCLLGTLFLVYVPTAYSQTETAAKRNIKGYVKDAETGEALPYANVVLKGSVYGSSTNVDGYFVIINAPANLDTLQVSYIGYLTQLITVKAEDENREFITIHLEQNSLRLAEIVITGEVDMLEVSEKASQITLSPQQLMTLPNFGEVDVFRSLQLLPGISAIGDGSSGLFVRGGTPDQNLVLLDGMKIYHVDHFFGFFSAFNADAIKDIKMYKGGFPAKYGGRISSVVDMTGKTGNVNNFSMGAGVNLLSGNAVFEAPLFENATLLMTMRRSYTDFIQSSLYNDLYGLLTGDQETDTSSGTVELTQGRIGRGRFGGGGFGGNFVQGESLPQFYYYDLNGKFTWTPTQKDILSFSIYNGRDYLDQSQDFGDLGFGFGGRGGFGGGGITGSLSTTNVTKWGNTGLSGKWSRQWHDRFYSNFNLATSTYFSDYNTSRNLDTSGFGNDSLNVARGFGRASNEENRIEDVTLRFDNELRITNSNKLSFGMELSDFSAGYKSTLNDSTNIFSRDTKAKQNSYYLQDEFSPTSSLELTLGVRATFYNQSNSDYVEPRASFVYRVIDNFRLKGAWGKYNQFINRIVNENVLEGSRDFWLLADDDLKPSSAEHYIMGLSYENENYLFDVEGYQKNMSNLLEYSQRTNRNRQINNPLFLGDGVAKGVEFLLQKKHGMFTGWAGYTLGKTEHIFPDLNNGNAFPADNDRTHEVNLVASVTKGLWDFSGTWVYATGKAYTAPESQYALTLLDGSQLSFIHVSDKNVNRLPDYHRLDLSVSRRFNFDNWRLDVGGSVFNAYNRKNVNYREYILDTTPVVITDKLMLGLTPTFYIRMHY